MIRLLITKVLDPKYQLINGTLQKQLTYDAYTDCVLVLCGNEDRDDGQYEIIIMEEGITTTTVHYDSEYEYHQDMITLLGYYPTFSKKTRPVEIVIGIGDDSGTWGTEYFDVPYETPESILVEVAVTAAKNEYYSKGYPFTFMTLYAIVPLDEVDEFYNL